MSDSFADMAIEFNRLFSEAHREEWEKMTPEQKQEAILRSMVLHTAWPPSEPSE